MPFKKGQSGNPKGKPKGVRDRRGLILDAIAAQVGSKSREAAELEWFKRLAAMALEEGDSTAMSMLTRRIVPELKSTDTPVSIETKVGDSLTEQAALILKQMAEGGLTPQEALSVLQALSVQAKIIETDQLEERIRKLEAVQ